MCNNWRRDRETLAGWADDHSRVPFPKCGDEGLKSGIALGAFSDALCIPTHGITLCNRPSCWYFGPLSSSIPPTLSSWYRSRSKQVSCPAWWGGGKWRSLTISRTAPPRSNFIVLVGWARAGIHLCHLRSSHVPAGLLSSSRCLGGTSSHDSSIFAGEIPDATPLSSLTEDFRTGTTLNARRLRNAYHECVTENAADGTTCEAVTYQHGAVTVYRCTTCTTSSPPPFRNPSIWAPATWRYHAQNNALSLRCNEVFPIQAAGC